MNFEQSIAAFAIGRLLSSDLPNAANQALEEGHDSKELAALAGSTSAQRSPRELEDMWMRGLRELRLAVPSRAEAGCILRDYYLQEVASGSCSPRDGAGEIVGLVNELNDVLPAKQYMGDGLGVANIVGLHYSFDELAFNDLHGASELEAEIKAECLRLLREHAA